MIGLRRLLSKCRLSKFICFTILSLILTGVRIQAFETIDNKGPQEIIEFHNKNLRDLYNQNELDRTAIKQQVLRSLNALFDFNRLSAQFLQNNWAKMSSFEKEQFVEALKTSFVHEIYSRNTKYSSEGLSSFTLKNQITKEKSAKLEYSFGGNKGKIKLTISMLKYQDASWKITNVKAGKKDLRQRYYSFCKKLLDDYSLAYLIAELKDSDYVVLEDFEGNSIGQLPKDWTWRDKDRNKHKPYKIKEENGNKYLAAEDTGESVILVKETRWNIKKYPYISFRWRAKELPEGGDERFGPTNDSGAAIYITYNKTLLRIPKSVKFVWSTTLPVGSATKRSGIGRPWNVVVESGPENLGEWRTYVLNAYEAYQKTFGGNPPDRPLGIGILSDANSSHSKAYSDYDDIRALRHADADSGIKNILKGE